MIVFPTLFFSAKGIVGDFKAIFIHQWGRVRAM
jgi:hypothetical protein